MSSDLNKMINKLDCSTKHLRKLRYAVNEILSNSAYSDLEMDKQIKRLKGNHVAKKEIDLVKRAWVCRKIMVNRNIELLEKIIEVVENEQKTSS